MSGGAFERRSAAGAQRLEEGPPAGEVHLWHAVLTAGSGGAEDEAVLAGEELTRAGGFAFAELRRHWVWGRATLRRVLARYLGVDPGEIVFAYGEHGKPAIVGSDLGFSLSHSGRRLALALARGPVLGVDIERVSRCVDALALAERYFAPAEARRLRAVPEGGRAGAFAGVWSAKEAYSKALARGLTVPLGDFEVAGELSRPAMRRTAPGDPRGPGDWLLAQTRPATDYVCTLAVAARRVVLVEHRHPGPSGMGDSPVSGGDGATFDG